MPAYAYRAVDASGRTHRGRLEAGSPAALSRSLEENGLLLLDAADAGAQAARAPTFGPGRRRSVLEVTQALAALLPAGMPLARALGTASELATGEVRTALEEIRGRVEQGDSIAAALARYPALFSPLYVGMVRAGERSGDLDAAFARLAEQLERDEELRGRLLSASIYPLILATMGGAAVVVLLLFVIPRFAELLEGAGASLPASTALLLSIATGLRRFWPVLLGALVLAVLAATAAVRSEQGRRSASALLLAVPGIRGLRRAVLAARFARLTGVLLGGGAPLLSALDDALESLDDPLARDEVARIRSRVREGSSLHGAIAEGGLFPPLLARLVAVGEGSGRLREFLLKAAEMFDARNLRTVQRLVALAEPAMIVFFGALVAFVALSLLQAIYGVNADAFR
ncbi:MAG TPA: type II secretion system F family protein [Longimicrobiaceae bacterium]|nr:type II secretion system F family protein [Longimicrobiaceae bacterium]